VDTIAERRLQLLTATGTVEVVAVLGKPREVGVDEWACACVTRFGGEERSIDIHGGDSMQALQMAMVTLDVELQHGAKCRGGTLIYFDEPFVSVLENSGMQAHSSNAPPTQDAT
jgi:hypothetical protein